MLNISTALKQALADDNRNYQNRAVITLSDSTVINVDNQHIMFGGVAVEDAVGDDNSFTALGSAVINSATLTLYNNDEIYSDYVFEGARVVIYTGLELSSGLEEVKKGTFIVDKATYGNATITLNLLDNMSKFDKPYSLSSITFPTSMRSVILDACNVCGVQLASSSASFPHNTYSIPSAPTNDSTTFREVISKCATIAGCFASCNVDGELELKWFDVDSLLDELEDIDGGEFDSANPYATGDNVDGGTFNPWNTGAVADGGTFTRNNVHYITTLYSQNIAVDDIVITQVKITIATKDSSGNTVNRTYTSGQDGYTIEIANNEFITESTAQTVLNWLATQFIGLTFRPCNITHLDDPGIEAGDVALVWDTKGDEHPILITRTNFNPGRPQTIVCGAESPSKNSSVQFSQTSKAYAEVQKQLKNERTEVQQAIDALAEQVSEAGGLYSTTVSQTGGGSITYYHNKPELEDSDIQIVISDVGITVTNDGGTTWYGLTVDGQLISSIMNTIGINFDWGVGGELLIKKGNNETLYVNADTGTVRIVADSFALSSGDTLATVTAEAHNYTDTILDDYNTDLNQQAIFNKLTNNGQTQGIYLSDNKLYVNASYIGTGTLSADRIGANSIAVSKLTGNITNGNWKIDLDAGTFTIGNISANNITTGTLSAARIGANSIAVSKLTGSITNGDWGIDLDNGTFSIGNISANNITSGTISADRIGSNSITADKLDVSNLSAIVAKIGDWYIGSGLQNTASGGTVYFTPSMLKLGAFEADSTGAIGGANWYIDASGNASFANSVNFGTSSNPSSGFSYTGGSVTNSATYDFLKITEALNLGASGSGASLNVYGTTTFNSNVQLNSPATTYVDHEGTSLTSYIDSRVMGNIYCDNITITLDTTTYDEPVLTVINPVHGYSSTLIHDNINMQSVTVTEGDTEKRYVTGMWTQLNVGTYDLGLMTGVTIGSLLKYYFHPKYIFNSILATDKPLVTAETTITISSISANSYARGQATVTAVDGHRLVGVVGWWLGLTQIVPYTLERYSDTQISYSLANRSSTAQTNFNLTVTCLYATTEWVRIS